MIVRFKFTIFAAMAVILASGPTSRAAVSVTSTSFTYLQNFNTLSAATGVGLPWTNDSTLTGWHLFTAAGAPITSYSAGNGSDSTGNFYSFGATSTSTDRAFGAVASGSAYFGSVATGSVAGYAAVSLTNNTGIGLNRIGFTFSGEQWRNSGETATQGITLQYGFGPTFGGVTSWTSPGGNFNWTAPLGGVAGAVDGNGAGLVANRGGMLTGLPWSAGSTLWLRWEDINDVGFDHGLAVDDFQVQFVPEPGALLIGSLALLRLLIRRR